ncbi:hypothetical protein H257_18204 [Aphanomyces astaci]|uniref:Uncharacterized protein n=1 Tax=Aphanomyces astaci TaxID=112090 RepID=W4FC02_APHAT|nr:hypothetical protein H257_18204 [Aphanomyces astaci]ETV65000.1 hypothetical protein H257_18204 [Aphanomyces astaci]|eukprot:XP_009845525.1 hypothetical protein H257_18204 [Aphanomyces astaci]
MSSNTPSEDLRDAVLWVGFFAVGCEAHQVEALELLLRHGANVIVGDSSGNTALHKAAYLGYGDCVSLLLQYGAGANNPNNMQQTPLDLASLFDKPDMVALLSSVVS